VVARKESLERKSLLVVDGGGVHLTDAGLALSLAAVLVVLLVQGGTDVLEA